MRNQARPRLTGFRDQARAGFDRTELYARLYSREFMAGAIKRPVTTTCALMAAFTLAAGACLSDPPGSTATPMLVPATPPPSASPAIMAAERISLDAEDAANADRAGRMALLEQILSRPGLGKKDIGNLQVTLNGMDYPAGRRDGLFGARTARGVMSALEQNPGLTAKISPWVVERLLYNGQRKNLGAFLRGNPDSRTVISAALEAPQAKTSDRQIWLAAYGLYKNKIDNIPGPDTSAAVNQFRILAGTPLPGMTPPVAEAKPSPPESVAQPSSRGLPHSESLFGQALSRDEIAELETILHKGGYYPNPKATGRFNEMLGGAVIDYLRDNQSELAGLSPWILQNLIGRGYRDDLVAMVYGNDAARDAVHAKLDTLMRNLPAADRSQVAETQIWMSMTGLYSGPLNGLMNNALQSAVRDFAHYAAAPRPSTPEAGAIRDLVENIAFRRALRTGDLANAIRIADTVDSGPLRLLDPLLVMRKTSDYKPRRTVYDREMKPHQGTDYGAPSGTPVTAPAEGIVIYSDRANGYGQTVLLAHGHGLYTRYAHLRTDDVRPGQHVRAGQKIAEVGSTGGRSTAPHLHYEIIISDPAGTPVAIDADAFRNRDLHDSRTRMEAIVDARRIMRNQGWGQWATHAAMESVIPASAAVITASTGQRLVDVFAADRGLLRQTSERTLSALREAGFGAALDRLAAPLDHHSRRSVTGLSVR